MADPERADVSALDSEEGGGSGGASQPKSEEDRKPSCRPPSSGTGQNCNSSAAGSKPEPLVLKIDERQRLARERRGEREKQIAAREALWLEREERAKQYYEKLLEERRRRLEEQRIREDRRRAAVEEKRKQRLEEEKVRHEAVMRRTQEKSQRTKPKPNRWSWGGPMQGTAGQTSGSVESPFLFNLDLAGVDHHFHGAFSSYRRHDADRRSASAMNLSKHADPVITKRLSSSSATLLSSPDRALRKWIPSLKRSQSKPRVLKEQTPRHTFSASRRLPLTPWENSVVSRLLTPTHSYLARSKSAASLSGNAASCHPASSTSFKSLLSQSADRPRPALSSLDSVHRRRTSNPVTGTKRDKEYVRKSWTNLSVAPPPNGRKSWTPGNQKNRTTLPSPVRATHKAAPRPPTPKKVRSPIQAPPTKEEPPSPGRPLSPGNVRPLRAELHSQQKGEEPEEEAEPQREAEIQTPGKPDPSAETAAPSKEPPSDSTPLSSPPSAPPSVATPPSVARPSTLPLAPPSSPPSVTPPSGGRPSSGPMDAEEATRLMAEKRRQAREQREREEEEKRQREEAERRGREEMARRKAEERARREEEAQRLAEERRKREEEEKLAEEERLQREQDEAKRLQQQKEEEEARLREEAERVRLEREKHFQKQEAERLERKKRLEEIMKRTRRSDPTEKKSDPHRNGEFSEPKAELTVSPPRPAPPSVSVTSAGEEPDLGHGDRNGHRFHGHFAPALPTVLESSSATEAQPKENGVPARSDTFEEVIELPVGTKPARLEDDHLVPIVAFRENGSLRPLASIEEVQARQQAEPP